MIKYKYNKYYNYKKIVNSNMPYLLQERNNK